MKHLYSYPVLIIMPRGQAASGQYTITTDHEIDNDELERCRLRIQERLNQVFADDSPLKKGTYKVSSPKHRILKR